MKKGKYYLKLLGLSVASSLIAIIVSTSFALAETESIDYITSALHSINNETDAIDYKMPEEVFQLIKNSLKSGKMSTIQKDETEAIKPARVVKKLNELSQTNNNDVAIAKSYLIEHDIISRKERIVWDKELNKFKATAYEKIGTTLEGDFEQKIKLIGDSKEITQSDEANNFYGKVQDLAAKEVEVLQEKKLIDTRKKKIMLRQLNTAKNDFKKEMKNAAENATTSLLLDHVRRITSIIESPSMNLSVMDEDPMLKSDFLMALYKSHYGVLDSRPVVFQLGSVRNTRLAEDISFDYWNGGSIVQRLNGYWGTNIEQIILEDGTRDEKKTVYNAIFPLGDFYAYCNPNVYELYLKEMLDKGIITESELNGGTEEASNSLFNSESNKVYTPGFLFGNEYRAFSESARPVWWKSLGMCTASKSGALGRSIAYTEEAAITQRDPNYFENEEMFTLDALKFAEKFLRITEKNMTKTEADIVAYKFGLNYLDGLKQSEKDTVSFLIAKGILNFEDPNSFINLYGIMTNEQAYQLLYRIANKDSRYDFSKIQLTDSESFWQARGYASETFELYKVQEEPILQDLDISIEEENRTPLARISQLFVSKALAASGRLEEYKITKTFDKTNHYKYKGNTLSDLHTNAATDEDIDTIEEIEIEAGGNKLPAYKVVFKVKSTSKDVALNLINSGLTLEVSANNRDSIPAVTKIIGGSNGTILIPKKALQQSFSNITILSDKVLQNNETGALAILLPEQGYAMVGNTVYRSEDLIVTNSGDDVYYNLEVILGVLSNAFLEDAGIKGIFSCNKVKESKHRLISEVGELGSAYCTTIKATRDMIGSNNGDEDGYTNGDTISYYKVDSVTKGINTLVRTFKVKNSLGKEKPVTFVIDYRFVIPNLDVFNAKGWLQSATNKTFTVSDAANVLYERPDDNSDLQKWWDSNYGMSNALANFVYGTKSVQYVQCGYLAPSLTVLSDSSIKDDDIEGIMKDNGFAVRNYEGDYAAFINGSTNSVLKSYFNGTGMSTGLLLDMALENRRFVTLKGEKTSYGAVYGTNFIKNKAGVLYRNLDSDSRFIYNSNQVGVTGTIEIESRTENEQMPANNSVIVYKNKKWLYRGINKETNCILLQPMFPSSEWEPNNIMRDNNGRYRSITAEGDMVSSLAALYAKYFPTLTTKPYEGKEDYLLYGAHKDGVSFLGSGQYVLNKGLIHRITKDGLEQLSVSQAQVVLDKKLPVASIPIFYLPAGSFYIYKSASNNNQFQLGVGQTAAALCFSNFFYSGINDSIINTIIAKDSKITSIGSLRDGQEVLIGDTVWYKKGKKFIAKPIKNNELSVAAKKDNSIFLSTLVKLFGGLRVTCDTRQFNLINYFSNIEVGPLQADTLANKEGLAYQTSDGIYVWKKNKQCSSETRSSYTSVQMDINPDLMVRPLNAENTRFTVVYTTNTAVASGSYGELPFFGETLSYAKNQYASIAVEQTRYTPTQGFLFARDRFMSMYRKAMLGDVWNLLKSTVFTIANYLFVISWMCFLILTCNVGRGFFDAVAMIRNTSQKRGFDLIKILSFGVYSLDEDPPASRIVIISFTCVFIMLTILGLK